MASDGTGDGIDTASAVLKLPRGLRSLSLVVAFGCATLAAIAFTPLVFQLLPDDIGEPLWRVRWLYGPVYLLCLVLFLGSEPLERG